MLNMKQDIKLTGGITFNLSSFQDLTFNIFVCRADSDAEAWRPRHGALYPQQAPVPRMFPGC